MLLVGKYYGMKRDICIIIHKDSLIKAFALLNSIQRFGEDTIRIKAVCLDELSRLLLNKMKYSNLESIALHKIEAQVPELNPLRNNLTLAEYYSHCVPFVAEYVLAQFNLDDIIMLNSDC